MYACSKEVTLYKTEYCRNWAELGYCRYDKKCRYAHGTSELRKAPRHYRYKTQDCRSFHSDGTCAYGIRCTFIHDTSDPLPPRRGRRRSSSSSFGSCDDCISINSSSGSSVSSFNTSNKQYYSATDYFMMKQSIETIYYSSATIHHWM